MASRTPGRPAITQRQRLGRKLRTLRELAGLTNRDLEYARLVFEMADVGTRDIPNKVEGRLRRQNALFDQSKRWWLLMTEAALYWQPGSVVLQIEQLERIGAVMQLPNVQIGFLPLRGQARVIFPEGFQVYADRADDADTLVKVELVPDEITFSTPDEVEIYVREFDRLRRSAVFGDAARDLLSGITEDRRRLG